MCLLCFCTDILLGFGSPLFRSQPTTVRFTEEVNEISQVRSTDPDRRAFVCIYKRLLYDRFVFWLNIGQPFQVSALPDLYMYEEGCPFLSFFGYIRYTKSFCSVAISSRRTRSLRSIAINRQSCRYSDRVVSNDFELCAD